jgi:hypothetical protein
MLALLAVGCAADEGEPTEALARAVVKKPAISFAVRKDPANDFLVISGRRGGVSPSYRSSLLALRTVTAPQETLSWSSSVGPLQIYELHPKMACRAAGCQPCEKGSCPDALPLPPPIPRLVFHPRGDVSVTLSGRSSGRTYAFLAVGKPSRPGPALDDLALVDLSTESPLCVADVVELATVAEAQLLDECFLDCEPCDFGACVPKQDSMFRVVDLEMDSSGSACFEVLGGERCGCPNHTAANHTDLNHDGIGDECQAR